MGWWFFFRKTTNCRPLTARRVFVAESGPCPANKTGLTDVYGEVWRTGGTKTQTGDQLDDYLEQRAAKVETKLGGTRQA